MLPPPDQYKNIGNTFVQLLRIYASDLIRPVDEQLEGANKSVSHHYSGPDLNLPA
jgi:hypothetical protein